MFLSCTVYEILSLLLKTRGSVMAHGTCYVLSAKILSTSNTINNCLVQNVYVTHPSTVAVLDAGHRDATNQ